jgi:hypothetical protein
MKKLLPALISLLLSLHSFAGWDMLFCDSVDTKTNCLGKSTVFQLSDSAVRVLIILQNADGLHTGKIYFEVYRMDQTTYAEDLTSTEETKTEPTQATAYQTIRILQKGHYLVKARDAFKDYITSREFDVR